MSPEVGDRVTLAEVSNLAAVSDVDRTSTNA
jgi:hypothetical protein